MSTNTVPVRYQFRRGTVEEWNTNASTVPLAGEPCVTTSGISKGLMKIGDGSTTWENLSYSGGTGLDAESIFYDAVITTQEEFDELRTSAVWLGFETIAFKGDFVVPSGEVLKIPASVRYLVSFDASLSFSNINANTDANCAIYYETLPEDNDYKFQGFKIYLDGISGTINSIFCNCKNISHTSINAINVAGTSHYSMYSCSGISHCDVTIRGASSERMYVFYDSFNVSDMNIDIVNTASRGGAVYGCTGVTNVMAKVSSVGNLFGVTACSNVANVHLTLYGTTSWCQAIHESINVSNVKVEMECAASDGAVVVSTSCENITNVSATVIQTGAGACYGIRTANQCSNIDISISASYIVYGLYYARQSNNISLTISNNREGGTSAHYGMYYCYQCSDIDISMTSPGTAYILYYVYRSSNIYGNLSAEDESTSTLYGGRYVYTCSNIDITVTGNSSVYGFYTSYRINNIVFNLTATSSASYGLRTAYDVHGGSITLTSGPSGILYGISAVTRVSGLAISISRTETATSSAYGVASSNIVSNLTITNNSSTGYVFSGSKNLSNIQYSAAASGTYTGTNLYIDTETVVEV